MPASRVVVIGAGIAGLVAALELSRRGCDVTVLERAADPGGKMRTVQIGGQNIDAGPTVFTMRSVFDRIFAAAGAKLEDWVTLRPAKTLARHAWGAEDRLDLFADRDQSAAAIGDFAGAAEARGYRRFCDHAREIYDTLDHSFIRNSKPSLPALIGRAGATKLLRIDPFSSLWSALGAYFRDPRLRQLFGRYATYCGSSPYLAPATLMLVAHVEQSGVWLIEGGMKELAAALARLAVRQGAMIRCGTEAAEIVVRNGRATAVQLSNGERLEADAVIVNADLGALQAGALGRDAALAVPLRHQPARSLSAITWAVLAEASGFPLIRHNVFFSNDYTAEFDQIFRRSAVPRAPTVYVCAQDREDQPGIRAHGAERLLCLINAPANGDTHIYERAEIERCEERTFELLERSGLRIRRDPSRTIVTTPTDFAKLFPGSGGALYGRACHGWKASFERPASRSRMQGLYLAGGGVHPGPGVPMAALSGWLAAESVIGDSASTARSRPAAMVGGTSTR
jgi:1-hydroxycarotenoid 3,4-desaturase